MTALQDLVAEAYDRHAPALYRYALMILADPGAAEDAVQQAFTKLLGQGQRAVPLDCVEAYLRTAVRNESYSLLRRRRREPRPTEELVLVEAVDPHRRDEMERLALERALRALPPEQREVVHLKAFEGRTFQEIATATTQSINTVASRYRYALEKMRTELGAEKGPR